jgi:Zn-finger nucleic acid-binding protein
MTEQVLFTCPRCSDVLDRLSASGIEVDVCSSCAGIWLDKGELAVLKVSGSFFEMLRLKPAGRRKAPPSSAAVTLSCPACPGTLSAFPLVDVAIDICGSCQGLWLDKGELDVALKALDSKTDQAVIDALTGVIRAKRSQ